MRKISTHASADAGALPSDVMVWGVSRSIWETISGTGSSAQGAATIGDRGPDRGGVGLVVEGDGDADTSACQGTINRTAVHPSPRHRAAVFSLKPRTQLKNSLPDRCWVEMCFDVCRRKLAVLDLHDARMHQEESTAAGGVWWRLCDPIEPDVCPAREAGRTVPDPDRSPRV